LHHDIALRDLLLDDAGVPEITDFGLYSADNDKEATKLEMGQLVEVLEGV
jgi:hypothetical protein